MARATIASDTSGGCSWSRNRQRQQPSQPGVRSTTGLAFKTLWTLTMREALILAFSDAFLAIGCCFVVATLMVPLMRNAARAAALPADAH